MSHMEKIRVLAADDEYWSRENLRNLLPWQEYGMEFLEPAGDGEEVLERMEQEHPDILLTDINMPFMDGLELLSRMQTEYPEVVTVAVSGYDDFEKVKGTFLSGGIDYLLKPVGREDLEQVIRKIMDILEKRKKQKEQEDRTASVLSDGAFSALLNNQLYGREYTVEGFDCRMSGNTVALIKYYDIADITEKSDHDILQAVGGENLGESWKNLSGTDFGAGASPIPASTQYPVLHRDRCGKSTYDSEKHAFQNG